MSFRRRPESRGTDSGLNYPVTRTANISNS